MKDQHEKIKGYRDLDEQEIELINDIKVLEQNILSVLSGSYIYAQLLSLKQNFLDKLEEIGGMRYAQKDASQDGIKIPLSLKQLKESHRCIGLAAANIREIDKKVLVGSISTKAYVQQATMWAVRSVALSENIKEGK